MQRRLQLVINPAAGRGRAWKLLPAVEAALRGAGHDLVVTPTRSLEHAEELAAAAIAVERVAVAMGGDGIVGRVASAVAAAPAPSGGIGAGLMAVLPGGRGNDLCRAVGLPQNAVAACAVLSTGVPRALDLGVVSSGTGEVAFLGIASIGFDSDVQERVLTSHLGLGPLVYLYGSLATVARWRHAEFACSVDGVPLAVRGWSVAVANSGRYGGGMRLAPSASLEDGLLDVVAITATGKLTFLRSLPKLFKGTHLDEPSVSVRTATTVHLAADRPFRVFADGDPVGTLPCTVTVRPGAVQVLLPT